MNKLDEVRKGLESRGYGEYMERIQRGIVMTYYNPSPLERLEKIGKAKKSREMLEKQQYKKLTYVQELESRRRIEEIIKKMEEDFGSKSKLSNK